MADHTFLFTDLEGSTALWDEHPGAMQDALAHHDALLRAAVADAGGRVVKETGDGLYAVLPSPTAAVAAAVAALRALASEGWGATGPLRARLGIGVGEAEARDDDWFGPALNLASRIMSAAHGGQALLSATAATAVEGHLPAGVGLVDLGEHRLRGVGAPERVHQLTVEGLPSSFPPLRSVDAFPAAVALPSPLPGRREGAMAGRDAELGRLTDAWSRAAGGALQVGLLSGEPGMGKTRLAEELAARVDDEGGLVLYGGCDEETVVAYQPFVEALRHYVRAVPAATLRERLHGLELDLARLFPDLPGEGGAVDPLVPEDAATARYRLFEAVTGVLTGAAASRPCLLILDDLHWIEKPTVLMLRHVLRAAVGAPLLVLVVYRDVEVVEAHPLRGLLTELRSESRTTSVELEGLTADASTELIRTIAGEGGAGRAPDLHQQTGGNPLFLGELVRHLSDPTHPRGDREALPVGVREVIARRVERLSEEDARLLSLAATCGAQFDVDLVARAAGRPVVEALDGLERMSAARLVVEDAERVGRFRFHHDLVRQVVYGELGPAGRARAHLAVGTAMEERGGPGRAAALAHHFTRATPLDGVARAIRYTTEAARDAVARLASEDAAALLEQALRLADQDADGDERARVELLTELAEALVYVDDTRGIEVAREAVQRARSAGLAADLGRAVAAFADQPQALLDHPGEVAALFDEARVALGEDHPELRARLLAFEAFAYTTYQLQGRDSLQLADDALALARRADDPSTLGEALFGAAAARSGTAPVDERVPLGEELVVLGRTATTARAAIPTAYGLRVMAGVHLERGASDALAATVEEMARFGQEQRWLPALAFAEQWEATRALTEGRFDDVRDRWERMARYQDSYSPLLGMQMMQSILLAREERDLAPLAGPLGGAAPENHILAQALRALAHVEAGEQDAASEVLDRFAAVDFNAECRQNGWSAVLGVFAEVAVRCEATAHAPRLFDLLTPFAGTLLTALLGLGVVGAADRHLGMLCPLIGRGSEAAAHFDAALVLEEGASATPLAVRTRYWRARSCELAPAERAAQLMQVADAATDLGMRALAVSARVGPTG